MKRENLLKAICLITKTNMINAGQCYYISDNAGLVDVYDTDANYIGMAVRWCFAVIETEMKLSQAEEVLRDLKGMYPTIEMLYEDTIISAVGIKGLYMLRMHHLIETCGTFNGRKLYAI